ncbi:MAG TPA: hypothetical protein VKA34_20600 [Balneolales bacterium]|nr:hypothetical protein [Balneolales bacterium]
MQGLDISLDDIDINRYGRSDVYRVKEINRIIFGEDRIINQYHHPDIVLLIASYNKLPVGYKIGYGRPGRVFYSAKGGIIPAFRRKGIAKKLLNLMMYEVYQMDYKVFSYDTFPNKHRGMIILGLNEGFKISDAKWNEYYQDYQIHLEKDLVKHFESI